MRELTGDMQLSKNELEETQVLSNLVLEKLLIIFLFSFCLDFVLVDWLVDWLHSDGVWLYLFR